MSFEILTRQEVSDKFKTPLKTLDYLVRTGQIPFFRVGKRGVRFNSDRLEKWTIEREGIEYRLGVDA
jgi:excisionase family DNA binding protein